MSQVKPLITRIRLCSAGKVIGFWQVKSRKADNSLVDAAQAYCNLMNLREKLLDCYNVTTMYELGACVKAADYKRLAKASYNYLDLRSQVIYKRGKK